MTRLTHLQQQSELELNIGPQTIRIFFHLEVTDAQFDMLLVALRAFNA